MHADTTPSDVPALSHRQILVVFSGIMLGMLLAAIDQTIVATALPTIVGDLGGLNHLSWVVTAYLLAETVSTPLFGKLGDLFGRKRLFQAAIVIFILGSVLSGLATNMGQLIAFRAVQGIGAGGLIVLAMALIADVVSPRERGRYQGYFGAVFGVSSVAGPLLGGFLTDHLSWRWVFYVNVPLGVLALFVTSAVLPAAVQRRKVRIDWIGTTLLSAAIVCLVLLTTWGGSEYAWGSPVIVGLAVASVVLAVAFVAVERRVEEPAIPLRLFRIRTFAIAAGVSFVIGVGLFGSITYLPTFLQVANGASASNSGLLLVPMMGGLLVSSILAGRVITRTGRYRHFPIIGMAVASVGMFLLSTLGTDSSRWESGAYMVVLGAGIGMVMQIIVLATQNEAPIADLGVATSTVTFFRAVGGSIGVALAGALFNARLTDLLGGAAPSGMTPEELGQLAPDEAALMAGAFADAITMVFRYAVPLFVAGFLLTWFLKEIPLRSLRAAAPTSAADGESSAASDAPAATPLSPSSTPSGNGRTAGNGSPRVDAGHPADLVDCGEASVATGG
ncbi:MAG TPA: MDR family MFS transporter [Acidimicrobiales bacterium]|nr:MDR family MFS transporter [Acidimicrobiales bacterium]